MSMTSIIPFPTSDEPISSDTPTNTPGFNSFINDTDISYEKRLSNLEMNNLLLDNSLARRKARHNHNNVIVIYEINSSDGSSRYKELTIRNLLDEINKEIDQIRFVLCTYYVSIM